MPLSTQTIFYSVMLIFLVITGSFIKPKNFTYVFTNIARE